MSTTTTVVPDGAIQSTRQVKPTVWYGPFGSGGEVTGYVMPGWESVRVAFEENFAVNLELGSQLVIYHDSEKVVDLSGKSSGIASYTESTLQNIYSSGKNMEAVCIALLVDRGLISYDDAVSKHWPEFGQHGKEAITIADVLRHEGGVPFFSSPDAMNDYKMDRKITAEDLSSHEKIESLIASSGNWNLSGQRHYHAWTRGWMLSAVIRRVDPAQRSLGQFMREEVCQPLQLDIYCGMSAAEQEQHQFADITPMSKRYSLSHLFIPAMLGIGEESIVKLVATFTNKDNPVRRHTFSEFQREVGFINTSYCRSCEIPSAGMQANARSVSKINALMANKGEINGVRLLSPETVATALSEPKIEFDGFLCTTYSFTKGGFTRFADMNGAIVNSDFASIYDGFWGWGGYGGSLSLWHMEKKVSLAYCMNALTAQGLGGPRGDRIVKAVQQVLKTLK